MSGGALEYERARSALTFIPPDDRDLWVRMGMALKDGFGDEGFGLWDPWSRKSDRYNERDARDVWRSCKANGGVTAGTLVPRGQGARLARRRDVPEADTGGDRSTAAPSCGASREGGSRKGPRTCPGREVGARTVRDRYLGTRAAPLPGPQGPRQC